MNLNTIKKIFVDNAPAIFTGLAIAGVVDTTILTSRATLKIRDELFDLHDKWDDSKKPEPTTIDAVKSCWAHCMPPAIALATTIYFILKANNAHVDKELELAALYSLYKNKHRDYKDKNRELFGDENDTKVEKSILKDRITEKALDYQKLYPKRAEEYLIYDSITDQFFYATYKEKEHAQEQLNRILAKECRVSYNYLLSFFKNADHTTRIGNVFGWFMDDTFAEYYYWNESFYGRPYAELEFVALDEVTDEQEEIYGLSCSLEAIAENNMDDSEAKDSQDLHGF